MGTPTKVRTFPGQPTDRAHLIDRIFFFLGTLASIWLAFALIDSVSLSWSVLGVLVVFWLVLAYLALPRLNRILASIYVPDYFIGRTRTSDGLLGDPINLALRGSPGQLTTAMTRAGWTAADPVTLRSSLRIIVTTLTRRSYPEAPVSPLLLFGRTQDIAYQQEVDGNPGQRHHVRFWKTPQGWPLPGGTMVDWLAAGTYDRKVGLSLFTLQVTHKIDANIDVERDHIVSSVTSAVPQVSVTPLVDFTTSYHSRNGGGDLIHTDGTLPILELAQVPPAPEAADRWASRVERRSLPFQVLLPALLALLLVPGLIWSAIANPDHDTPGLRWAAIGLAMVSLGLAVGVLRGSATARRILLLASLVSVLLRVADFHWGGDRFEALFQAGFEILILLALSSPAADAWTRPRDRGRPQASGAAAEGPEATPSA